MKDSPVVSPAATLRARLAVISAEHAAVWRQLSMSEAWQKLLHLEGAMQELERMIAAIDPPPPVAPTA